MNKTMSQYHGKTSLSQVGSKWVLLDLVYMHISAYKMLEVAVREAEYLFYYI